MHLRQIEKNELLTQLREKLALALEQVTLAQKSSQEGATHEENRSESDKDMRATEASYIARGQAERVITLRAEIALLELFRPRSFGEDDAIAAGALVVLVDESRKKTLHWVMPAGGGVPLVYGDTSVSVLTTRSPLGQNLIGLMQGDVVGLDGPDGSREFEVEAVA